MLFVADVHGATDALARVAAEEGGQLCVLGDLINFIDYRTLEGIAADVTGRDFVARMVALRTSGDLDGARQMWRDFSAGRESEVRAEFDRHVEDAYREICGALAGSGAIVTHGNVDRPDLLRRSLPEAVRYVDGEVVEIEGFGVGFAGGGMPALGIAGEVSEDEMASKLDGLGSVDILCTHVPPALGPLSRDVIGGRQKGSVAVLDYLERKRPRFHYFGDIHQPQANRWRHGDTMCINVGYFRATGRAVRHG